VWERNNAYMTFEAKFLENERFENRGGNCKIIFR
jgi:hypothetical protein